MWRMATMRRPLRSKRARISPVRPRANASGLTRIRVRSKVWCPPIGVSSYRRRTDVRWGALRPRWAARSANGGGGGPPGGGGGAGGPRCGRGGRLGLAEWAQLPRRVDRLSARVAAFLEAPHAARAAQEVRAHGVVAVRAQRVVELSQAGLDRLQLELAQPNVVEVLRRADDRVDDRADEREQRCRDRTADQDRVVNAPARVGERPPDQRRPDDDQDEDQDVDGRVQRVVVDPEDGDGFHGQSRKGSWRDYRNSRPKAYPSAKKTSTTSATQT